MFCKTILIVDMTITRYCVQPELGAWMVGVWHNDIFQSILSAGWLV